MMKKNVYFFVKKVENCMYQIYLYLKYRFIDHRISLYTSLHVFTRLYTPSKMSLIHPFDIERDGPVISNYLCNSFTAHYKDGRVVYHRSLLEFLICGDMVGSFFTGQDVKYARKCVITLKRYAGASEELTMIYRWVEHEIVRCVKKLFINSKNLNAKFTPWDEVFGFCYLLDEDRQQSFGLSHFILRQVDQKEDFMQEELLRPETMAQIFDDFFKSPWVEDTSVPENIFNVICENTLHVKHVTPVSLVFPYFRNFYKSLLKRILGRCKEDNVDEIFDDLKRLNKIVESGWKFNPRKQSTVFHECLMDHLDNTRPYSIILKIFENPGVLNNILPDDALTRCFLQTLVDSFSKIKTRRSVCLLDNTEVSVYCKELVTILLTKCLKNFDKRFAEKVTGDYGHYLIQI